MKRLLPLLLLSAGTGSAALPDGFSYVYNYLTFHGSELFPLPTAQVGKEILLATADFDGNGETDYLFTYDPIPEGTRDSEFNPVDPATGWTRLFFIEGDRATPGWHMQVVRDDFSLRLRALYDADGDGLPNALLNFGAKVLSVSNALHDFEVEAGIDSDGDGLSDLAEVDTQTSYFHADTDADTLPDGWEVARGRNPLVADVGYYDELRTRAFPGGEPSIEIARDRSVIVSGLYPAEGLEIVVQVSEDLREWRDGGSAEQAVSGVLLFQSPVETGFVRVAVREE